MRKDLLYDLYIEQQLSCAQIGEILNCKGSKVYYWLKRHEITTRNTKEAMNTAKMIERFTGENHPQWNGGRYITDKGYVKILVKGHPYANSLGYIFEHRYIMEQILGRYLEPDEIVHHKNGEKSDNSPENLELTTNKKHSSIHRRSQVNIYDSISYNELYHRYVLLKEGLKNIGESIGLSPSSMTKLRKYHCIPKQYKN